MDESWLASLPREDGALARAEDGIELVGLLVSTPPGRVRVLVWPLYLEFASDDVTEVQEISLQPEVKLRAAIAVDLRLRPGAPLLAVHSLDAIPVSALGGPLPFALATRPGRLVLPPAPRYAGLEAEYLRRHGLEPEQ